MGWLLFSIVFFFFFGGGVLYLTNVATFFGVQLDPGHPNLPPEMVFRYIFGGSQIPSQQVALDV